MKYGFIGCGNMGGAVAQALSKATKDILLSDVSGKGKQLAQSLGCSYGTKAEAAACDRVFLAVKPQVMKEVLAQLQTVLAEKKPLLITMAAGLKLETIADYAGVALPIIRIMPNTPVAVGKGVLEYCVNDLVTEDILQDFLVDMRHAGMLDAIEETLIDGACSVSGCGPAFAYLFIEALTEGAVACGVPRDKALAYAAETLAGAAEMVKATGKDPIALKDAVCSPNGSTLEGVKVLEDRNFRGIVKDCVAASYRRNQELGKK